MQAAALRHERVPAETYPLRESVYVHPGQILVAAQPTVVNTILGSCVAVCLHDGQSRLGGLNHFMMPQSTRTDQSIRFGDVAIGALVDSMLARGASARRLTAKIFGGAWSVDLSRNSSLDLGAKNVAAARQMLAEMSIPVLAEDVGGSRGRKLVYQTDDGSAFVRMLGGVR